MIVQFIDIEFDVMQDAVRYGIVFKYPYKSTEGRAATIDDALKAIGKHIKEAVEENGEGD